MCGYIPLPRLSACESYADVTAGFNPRTATLLLLLLAAAAAVAAAVTSPGRLLLRYLTN